GRIAVVHNGIIENHATIRSFLESQRVEFQSETDSETLAQLIGFFYVQTGDLLASVRHSLREVQGTFGVVVMCADVPQTLIAGRRGSPLIVGLGRGEFFVSSDPSAIVSHTSQVVHLDDNEVVSLGPDDWQATNIESTPVQKSVESLDVSFETSDLGRFEHHMLKEIYEQPESLRNAMRGRLGTVDPQVRLGGLTPCLRELSRCRRTLLFGCGTAWHAALVAEFLFEELAGIPADVEYSSELRYRNRLIEEGTLAIAISQSGETADTLAAVREMQMRGATTVGVVNTVGSTIARETDAGVYLHIGPEIGVASTKAFTAQIEVLTLLALDLGRRRHLGAERVQQVTRELAEIPGKVEQVLKLNDQIQGLAESLSMWDNWLYLGRGVNFPVALEGALKLKEVSYIHAEGLPAAEMKHGPLAMIDRGMPVVVIAPQDHTYDKILANIAEVRKRDGCVIAIATLGDRQMAALADEVIYVPATLSLLSPLVTAIPLQLLAYHAASIRGRDVDKPRNLIKSVVAD
ncbi:MAG: glutamine--fructose-6-phosphate transaminase (isomerizing), partial [Planctomycetaceae bacterium]